MGLVSKSSATIPSLRVSIFTHLHSELQLGNDGANFIIIIFFASGVFHPVECRKQLRKEQEQQTSFRKSVLFTVHMLPKTNLKTNRHSDVPGADTS